MTNTLIGLLSAGVLAVGGLAAAAGIGDSEPARTVSLPAATSSEDTTTGATTTTGTTTGVDISGPCDEAEHANDPRCTGGGTTTDADDDGAGEDRSGSNKGSDDDNHNDDDRSGSNSGRG